MTKRRHKPPDRGQSDVDEKKAVGRNGAERKYDLLTVLGSYALSQAKASSVKPCG